MYTNFIVPAYIPQPSELPSLVDVSSYHIGWGATDSNEQMSRFLNQVTLPILSDQDCKVFYGNEIFSDYQFCAGTSEKNSCQVNLFIKNKLI